MRRPLAVYIHIPFCASKCAYCDFASWPGRLEAADRYLEALKSEISYWKNLEEPGGSGRRLMDGYEAASLFVGGGTPSVLTAAQLEDLLAAAESLVPLAPGAEVTLEANPGTLTPQKLAVCRRAGVNRLSLGAQSFEDRLLKSLGRIHASRQIDEAVDMARAAGFDNLNLDLMYGLPGQSMEDWRRTLAAAVALRPEHISAYSLIVEPGTPMADRVARGEAVVPEDEAVNAMQRAAVDFLSVAGYERYEISNFARPGCACRHNMTYWLRGDYLGLGCAAHSMLGEWRFANPADLNAYLAGARRTEAQRLTREDAMEETLMLSTRTCRGLDLAGWRERFQEDFMAGREEIVRRLETAGLARLESGFLRLTLRGMEVQNAVVLELLR